ncbi:hypothetical protein JTB14_012133 [Gonioctena quinquepunctata]|nr:hypothetical protein JTB14_012133 [Gonioctena quinquepunctata]
MIMIQIPDELLDTLHCDFCHKVLSVGPVKVYPNRKTKCGRCSKDHDSGVVSKYALIADHGMFKCLNRFDGCRQLLTPNHVIDHESVCESKTYTCPACLETKIPTFLLVKHFKKNHRESFLETPSFRVQVTAPVTETYLYKAKDNLFFIKYETCDDVIDLNVLLLGEQERAERMKQKFIVYYGDIPRKVESGKKACSSFGYNNPEGFSLKKPKIEFNFVFVEFHLDLDISEFLSLSTRDINLEKKTGLPRIISLIWGFQQDHSEFSISPSSTSVLMKKNGQEVCSEIMVTCKCSIPKLRISHYLEVGPSKYRAVCELCKRYYQQGSPNILLIPQIQLFSVSLRNYITYSCIWRPWGCLESSNHSEVAVHEQNCSYQPPQNCPVPLCTYRGNLENLRGHFLGDHPLCYFRTSPWMSISAADVGLITQQCYVWAYHGFILMEISLENLNWKMTIFPLNLESRASFFSNEFDFLTFATNAKSCWVPRGNNIIAHFSFDLG